MNKRKFIDKTKMVIVVFFVLYFWIPSIRAESPPSPPVKFSFDISRHDNEIKKEIRIREYRSYYIALQFSHPDYHSDREKVEQIAHLVGAHTGRYPDGRYTEPGIIVPIHLKIVRLEPNQQEKNIYENTIETAGIYAGEVGAFDREIRVIDLEPGIYKLEVNTTKDCLELKNLQTETFLIVEAHPKLKFMPNR